MNRLNNYYNHSFFIPYYYDYNARQPYGPGSTYYNTPINNYPYITNMPPYTPAPYQYTGEIRLSDYSPSPFAVNIEQAAKQNNNFRTALWTGKHLQLTLMSINVGEDIGLEVHPELDQFIRIEQGQGLVLMGDNREALDFRAYVREGYAFIIPAGKWHNLINTGNIPIKLYSVYAPPQHPRGTVHRTKAEAEASEHLHGIPDSTK